MNHIHSAGWLGPEHRTATPDTWGCLRCMTCGVVINSNVLRRHTEHPEIVPNPLPLRDPYVLRAPKPPPQSAAT